MDKKWNKKTLKLEKIKDLELVFTEDGKLKIPASSSNLDPTSSKRIY